MNLNTNRRGRSTHLFSNHDPPHPPSATESDRDKTKGPISFQYWNGRSLLKGGGPSSTDKEASTGTNIPGAKYGKPWNNHYKKIYKILDFEGDISLAISTRSPRQVVNVRAFSSVDTRRLPLARYDFKHKNIVSILEIFDDSPSGFFVVFEEMAISLRQLVNCPAYPSELQAVALLHQTLDGLAYLELQGLSHGQLSYQNILIDQSGVVKLGSHEKFESLSRDVTARVMADFKTVTLWFLQKDPGPGLKDQRWLSRGTVVDFVAATTSVSTAAELCQHPFVGGPKNDTSSHESLLDLVKLAQVTNQRRFEFELV